MQKIVFRYDTRDKGKRVITCWTKNDDISSFDAKAFCQMVSVDSVDVTMRDDGYGLDSHLLEITPEIVDDDLLFVHQTQFDPYQTDPVAKMIKEILSIAKDSGDPVVCPIETICVVPQEIDEIVSDMRKAGMSDDDISLFCLSEGNVHEFGKIKFNLNKRWDGKVGDD